MLFPFAQGSVAWLWCCESDGNSAAMVALSSAELEISEKPYPGRVNFVLLTSNNRTATRTCKHETPNFYFVSRSGYFPALVNTRKVELP